ncbi:ATP synthase subunit I [Pelomonas sp. SE-A7]|uniref:ATP synthase subunit I n=1 Tax=Pelomonas sp. SE-A7 TaxID=3054953 RepID=UPI00259CE729|nr:ATP synthase subunit I [Pelomonas sp. SE-A7]MDM4768118.1 ATP synthase subunit I [Pelomonas sp. SE-A7]
MTPIEMRARDKASSTGWDDESEGHAGDEAAFKALSREEAEALKAKHPSLSPWRVVAAEAAIGGVLVGLWWVFAGAVQGRSALYGALAVVMPAALMAWGMTRRRTVNIGAAVLSFAVWELIKILLTGVILVAVVRQVADLSWLAMLLTMIGCLKGNWLALFTQGRFKKA